MSKLSVPMMTEFDMKTRQTKRSYGSIPLPSGSGVPFAMPKTGFLAKITACVDGTMTVTLGGGTAVLDPILGPWGIFSRIILSINGSKQVYNLDGLGAYCLMQTLGELLIPEEGGVATPYTHAARVYAAGVGAGANIWRLPFVIPVAPNDDELLGGFINMYDALQATLVVQMPQTFSLTAGVSPILVTGAAVTSFNGNLKITAETFDLPAEIVASNPPGGFLHTLNMQQFALAGTGEQQYKLENEGVYLAVLHHVAMNGIATSLTVDQVALGSQYSYKHYDMESQFFLTDQRMRYKRDLSPGLFVHDLFYQGDVNLGGWRDVFDASTVADFRTFITITPGATLGINPTVRVISRVLEPVPTGAAPKMRGA